jgi:uncharacterized protein YeaO (DUF488 family)
MRVLVERLWPRGVSKKNAAIDLWLKEITPSTELRQWFAHDPAKWKEFKSRYRKELREKAEAIQLLQEKAREGTITLLYAARDQEHNSALVLKDYLEARSRRVNAGRRSPKSRRKR